MILVKVEDPHPHPLPPRLCRRQSLHDPILVLNAESDEPGQVAKLVALVKDFVRGAGETAVEVK